eukprot:6054688-Prymnesium_polylepis.1
MVKRTTGGIVDADVPLMQAGLDSLGAVELRNQLQSAQRGEARLPSTVVFDHPTVRQLAGMFSTEGETKAAMPLSTSSAIGLDAVMDIVRQTAGGYVDADAPLMEAGVDSLGAVELRNQLQRAAGESTRMPSMLVFDHPTVRGLANFLRLDTEPGSRDASAVVGAVWQLTASQSCLGIQGTSCNLPGCLTSTAMLDLAACAACDLLGEVPSARWNANELPGGVDAGLSDRSRYGAFLDCAQLFDYHAFHMSVAEAAAADPQQRLVL